MFTVCYDTQNSNGRVIKYFIENIDIYLKLELKHTRTLMAAQLTDEHWIFPVAIAYGLWATLLFQMYLQVLSNQIFL